MNDEWKNEWDSPTEYKLATKLKIANEAMEQARAFNAEGLNGLVRGFIGNAEQDFRKAQAVLRLALRETGLEPEGKDAK